MPEGLKLNVNVAEARVLFRAVSRTWSPQQSFGMDYTAETCSCCKGTQVRKNKHRTVVRHAKGCLTIKLYNYIFGERKYRFLGDKA